MTMHAGTPSVQRPGIWDATAFWRTSTRKLLLHFTSESRRVRWFTLAVAWAVIGWLGVVDTLAVRDYVSMLDESSILPAESLPLVRSAPADYADAHTWVRYALAVEEGGPWRTRWTDIDNAPVGREVHWSSGLVHIISSAGGCGAPSRTSHFRGQPRAL